MAGSPTRADHVRADEDEEDLYGDLVAHEVAEAKGADAAPILLLTPAQLRDRLAASESLNAKLQEQVNNLQQKVDGMTQERDILLRNMSSLFTTARMEIARKNDEIAEQRRELDALKSQSSRHREGQR
eukprot:jgi/Mesvir1/25638/Mv01856-RA.1